SPIRSCATTFAASRRARGVTEHRHERPSRCDDRARTRGATRRGGRIERVTMTVGGTAGKARAVGEIMSHPVVTAPAHQPVAVVAERMRSEGVGSVIVVDGERAIGILTERDLVRLAAAAMGTETVSDWMTPDPDAVSSDVEVTTAFASLAEHGYRHIPVVDD